MTQSGRSAHWEARLTGDVIRMPTADLINQVVDEIVAYKASAPPTGGLLHGSATGDRPAEGAERLHRGLSRRVAEVLAVRAPHLDENRRLLIATMMLAVIKAVLPLVAAGPPERAAELTAELKSLLTDYLSTATEPAHSPGDSPSYTRSRPRWSNRSRRSAAEGAGDLVGDAVGAAASPRAPRCEEK